MVLIKEDVDRQTDNLFGLIRIISTRIRNPDEKELNNPCSI